MKTLKEITQLLDDVPLKEFSSYEAVSALQSKVRRLADAWTRTPDYQDEQDIADARRQARAKREAQKAIDRTKQVRKWIKDGDLVSGTFIKVRGTRDGSGIREFMEMKAGRLVCRQWQAAAPYNVKRAREYPNELRDLGYIKIAGMWLQPQDQITTHEPDKVLKLIG